MEKKVGLSIANALTEINKLAESESSFDIRWEKVFGSDEGTDVLSVEDFFAEFSKMKEFK